MRRVLILDDDALVGMLVETVSRLDGAQTRLCAAEAEFFEAVAAWQPTHVVLDLTMPGMAGEEVLRRLAEQGCGARIVIASGAEPQRLADAAQQARAAGLAVAGTLSKPFALATLRGLLAG